MAQIKKRFIAPNAIDGSKLRFLNNEAVRALGADGSDIELLKLTSSNVLQFLRTPQVSVDPTFDNDISRKSYVDSQVSSEAAARQQADAAEQAAREAADAAEQSAREQADTALQNSLSQEVSDRQAADAGLQSQINTEKGRIDAILLASDADKDSFAEIVQLINSVDTTNDQAFASYVLSNDAALAQEVSNRQAGDSQLQSNLDAEEAAREAADSDLQDAIDQEVSDRQAAVTAEAAARSSGDMTLQGNLDAEQSAREAADAALDARLDVLEADPVTKSYVDDADQDLQDQIDALQISTGGDVAAEQAARIAADNALDARLDVIEGSDTVEGSVAKAEKDAKDHADSIVASEQAAREQADAGLQSQIDTEKSRIDAILLASDADKDSFAEIVQLINSVDTTNDNAFASYVLSNDAALAQEISDRQSGDNQLQSNINAEQSARELADSNLQGAISQEISDRQAAVNYEAAVRSGADTTLQSNIEAEQAAREAADAAEAAARAAELPRHAKFATTLSSTDVSNGYVDLLHVVLPSSVHVFIDRLACHEDTDYTLSTVNGKTRVTFSSSFMSSEEAAQAGDLLRCAYAYKNADQSSGSGGGGDTGGGDTGGGDSGGGSGGSGGQPVGTPYSVTMSPTSSTRFQFNSLQMGLTAQDIYSGIPVGGSITISATTNMNQSYSITTTVVSKEQVPVFPAGSAYYIVIADALPYLDAASATLTFVYDNSGSSGGGSGGGGSEPVLNPSITLDQFSFDAQTGTGYAQWTETDLQPASTVNLQYYSDVLGTYVTVVSVGETAGMSGLGYGTPFNASEFLFETYNGVTEWRVEVAQLSGMNVVYVHSAPVFI